VRAIIGNENDLPPGVALLEQLVSLAHVLKGKRGCDRNGEMSLLNQRRELRDNATNIIDG